MSHNQYILPLSFPIPTTTVSPPRQPGQGCTACIHQHYCGTFYWHIRFQERTMSNDYGRACGSWSNDKKDLVKGKSDGDFYQIDKMMIDNIAAEKNQNGSED